MAGQNEPLLGAVAALIVGVGRQPDGRVAIGPAALAKERDPLGLVLPPATLAHEFVDAIKKSDLALERNHVR
jgi:hypothetical protein